jgi:hypothetical protein
MLTIKILPKSPVQLSCPFCKAKPGKDCATSEGGFSLLHVARIKKAATLAALNKSRRKRPTKKS